MQIYALQLPNLINNLVQSAKIGNVVDLQPGSVVPAIVQEIDANSYATVKIFGQNIKAKLEANLQEGDKANLYVTGNLKNGAMELKLINLIANPIFNLGMRPSAVDVEAIIRAVGLPPTKEIKKFVDVLLDKGLPITSQTLKSANTVLQLPLALRPPIDVLITMVQLGIQIDPNTVQIIQDYEKDSGFQSILKDLLQQLEMLVLKDEAANLTPDMRTALEKTEKVIRQLIGAGQNFAQLPLKQISSQEIQAMVSLLGLDYDQKAAALLRQLLNSNPQTIKAELQAWLDALGPNLKQALLDLEGMRAGLKAAGYEQLADAAGRVLNQVTAQQLISQSVQDSYGVIYRFFSLPLGIEGQQETAQFQVMSRKGDGRRQIDPANCYLLISLNLANLGGLDIHMNIIDKAASIRFVSEKVDCFSEFDQQELGQVMSLVGFRLNSFSIEAKTGDNDLRAGLPPVITQIDLKV